MLNDAMESKKAVMEDIFNLKSELQQILKNDSIGNRFKKAEAYLKEIEELLVFLNHESITETSDIFKQSFTGLFEGNFLKVEVTQNQWLLSLTSVDSL